MNSKTISANTINVKTIRTQIKRECWENKTSFFYAPLVVSSLVFIFMLVIAVHAEKFISKVSYSIAEQHEQTTENTNDKIKKDGAIDLGDGKPINIKNFDLEKATDDHPQFFGLPVEAAITINSVLIATVFFIVLLIYAHGCLFDDRKNRDILFWRSMPVSENINVLVKLGTILFLGPVVLLVLNLIIGLLAFIVSFIFFLAHGVPLGAIFASMVKSHAIIVAFKCFAASLVTLVFFLPVFSFILFCSSFAKKSPMFTSSLIPLVLIVIEKILQVTMGISFHFADMLNTYWQELKHITHAFSSDESFALNAHSILVYVIAASISVLLIAGSIWLRNNRYEL